MKNNQLDQSQVSSSEMNIQIQEDKLSTSKSVGESAGEYEIIKTTFTGLDFQLCFNNNGRIKGCFSVSEDGGRFWLNREFDDALMSPYTSISGQDALRELIECLEEKDIDKLIQFFGIEGAIGAIEDDIVTVFLNAKKYLDDSSTWCKERYSTPSSFWTPTALEADIPEIALIENHKKARLMWQFWEMETPIYNSHSQWLPRELLEDVNALITTPASKK